MTLPRVSPEVFFRKRQDDQITPGKDMDNSLNRYSSRITQPKVQGASQAMLYGTGLTREDMDKAQVGIASVWYEGNTCNMHLDKLAAEVKKGVVDAGAKTMLKASHFLCCEIFF